MSAPEYLESRFDPATLAQAREICLRLFAESSTAISQIHYLCSMLPGEGTTWTIAALADSLARQTEKRVLLVDARAGADLVRLVDGDCSGASSEPGPTRYSRIRVADAGLGSESRPFSEVAKILEQHASGSDVVLIDGPPLSTASDLSTLRGHVDGIGMVIESERHRVEVIESAVGRIRASGVPVSGVIINRKTKWIPDAVYRRL